jgi:cysteinyl-tRNA synthetase
VVRFFLLHTHYRSPIEFSDAQLKEIEATLDRYYVTVLRVGDFLDAPVGKKEKAEGVEELENTLSTYKARFEEAMDDDFNTALAIGHMFELVREVNRFLDGKPSGNKARALVESSLGLLRETGSVLRLFERTPAEWYASIMDVKQIGLSADDIEALIQKRQEARKQKDWAEADRIRDSLDEKGIILEDKPAGTVWRVKAGS